MTKTQRAYRKWGEKGPDGARFLKEDRDVESKLSDPCTVWKILQQQTRGWSETFEIKCFHKEREQRGRENLIEQAFYH